MHFCDITAGLAAGADQNIAVCYQNLIPTLIPNSSQSVTCWLQSSGAALGAISFGAKSEKRI